ncbi:MAG: aldo/keto reductase, partial [Thermodesulfobacteriota bacterium]
PVVSNQVLYNLNYRNIERELLPYCDKNQVTILAYTPLDSGTLAKSSRLGKTRGMEVLDRIANELQKTIAQVALNWCTAHPYVIAIPKSNSVARTVENCGASGWRLNAEEIRLLDEAFS